MGKILLTGANGFIAAHVLKILLEVCLSHQLYTIPLFPPPNLILNQLLTSHPARPLSRRNCPL